MGTVYSRAEPDMPTPPAISPQQTQPEILVRIGGWLFKQRTWLPIPLVVLLLAVPQQTSSAGLLWAGVLLVVLSEATRLWGVRHIGVVSRTRSDRLGPLVDSGPFAAVRNPLYLANIGLWVGFALSARLPLIAPLVALALALEYHAIVRWEERLLETRLGDRYRTYASRVPRWIPTPGGSSGSSAMGFSWRDTILSERGTLIAILLGYLLLYGKSRLL